MLIHFLNKYDILGRVGDKIRISGEFPGMREEDFVFLNKTEKFWEDEQAFKIERIEYKERNTFKAVIAAE
jgi:hypothetical protein